MKRRILNWLGWYEWWAVIVYWKTESLHRSLAGAGLEFHRWQDVPGLDKSEMTIRHRWLRVKP